MVSLQAPFSTMRLEPISNEFQNSTQIADRLLKLSLATGYDIIQRNGQRYFGPPPNWVDKPPARGSEVFVGRLPRDCYEDELQPIFEDIGMIYEIRMMMNFTGFNRGFAFVTFCNPQTAWDAVKALHNFEIRPGHKIGVSKSIDNCRLYVGGIHPEVSREDVWIEVQQNIPQIVASVILYPDIMQPRRNRGFVFLEFETHREAAMAKRHMTSGPIKLFDKEVTIDWADPEPDLEPAVVNTLTKLFVRNLGPCTNSDKFRSFLRDVVPPECITRVYCNTHYAFLHFTERQFAEQAKSALERCVFGGHELEVQWARPKSCSKAVVSSNCRSVPPRLRRLNQTPMSSDDSSSASTRTLTPEHGSPVAISCVQQYPLLGSYNPRQGEPTYATSIAAKPFSSGFPPVMTDQLPFYQDAPQPIQNGTIFLDAQQIYDTNNNKYSPIVSYAAPYMPENKLYLPPVY